MTSWENVGVFGPDITAILWELLEYFENSHTECVVQKEPPTARLASCTDAERKRRAENIMTTLDCEVTEVVFLANSNTADWGSGYIYHNPPDRRDIALKKEISGSSGQNAADVERELQKDGYNISKRHFINCITKQDVNEFE